MAKCAPKQIAVAMAGCLREAGIDVGDRHVWYRNKKNSGDPRAHKRAVVKARDELGEHVYSIHIADDRDEEDPDKVWGAVHFYTKTCDVEVVTYMNDDRGARAPEARAFKARVERILRAVG